MVGWLRLVIGTVGFMPLREVEDTMRIFNDYGNIVDDEVKDFSDDLATRVGDLTARLFKEGLTVLEARGLSNYLCSSVEFAIVMQIMQAQMKQKGCDGNMTPYTNTEETDCG